MLKNTPSRTGKVLAGGVIKMIRLVIDVGDLNHYEQLLHRFQKVSGK